MRFTSTFDLDKMGYFPPSDLFVELPDGCCIVAALATDLEEGEPEFNKEIGKLTIDAVVDGDAELMKTAEKVEVTYAGENYNARKPNSVKSSSPAMGPRISARKSKFA